MTLRVLHIDDDARWPIEAARAADAKSADDVVVLEVGPVLALCSHFVIASATNTTRPSCRATETPPCAMLVTSSSIVLPSQSPIPPA